MIRFKSTIGNPNYRLTVLAFAAFNLHCCVVAKLPATATYCWKPRSLAPIAWEQYLPLPSILLNEFWPLPKRHPGELTRWLVLTKRASQPPNSRPFKAAPLSEQLLTKHTKHAPRKQTMSESCNRPNTVTKVTAIFEPVTATCVTQHSAVIHSLTDLLPCRALAVAPRGK